MPMYIHARVGGMQEVEGSTTQPTHGCTYARVDFSVAPIVPAYSPLGRKIVFVVEVDAQNAYDPAAVGD